MSEFKTKEEIQAEVEALQKQLAQKVAELKNFKPVDNVTLLANTLHKYDCHWNHTDGCSWEYESWEKPGYARNRYLSQAGRLLRKYDYDLLVNVIKDLNRTS